MPLLPGKKNIGHNIEVEQKHDKPHKQAVAIALSEARKTEDVMPVDVDDPERTLALKEHEEGITKSQDKVKVRPVGDSDDLEFYASQVAHGFTDMNSKTAKVATPYLRAMQAAAKRASADNPLKFYAEQAGYSARDIGDRWCRVGTPELKALAASLRSSRAKDLNEFVSYKEHVIVKLPSGRFYVKPPGGPVQTGFNSDGEARKWIDQQGGGAKDMKRKGKDEMPMPVKPVSLVPGPSGEENEVSYATRRVKDASPHEESVEALAQRIKKAVKAARADGTVGMSKANLKQVVSTSGLHFANANHFERSFSEALSKAGVSKFVTDRAKATDMKATLPIEHAGSEPKDHMIRALRYEIAGDRARALDSYRAAASGFRKANDQLNEGKAREGVAACTSIGYDVHYMHPGAGKVRVCDSAATAERTALERTRAGEEVHIIGTTVKPGRARAKDDTGGPPPVDEPVDPADPSPVPVGDEEHCAGCGAKASEKKLYEDEEGGGPHSGQFWCKGCGGTPSKKAKAKDSKTEVLPV